MTTALPQSLTLFAIYAVYFFTFLLAGGGKFKEGKVPEWFTGQFSKTFLARVPGLPVAYWTIATLETLIPILLAVSLVNGEFLAGHETFFLQLAVSVASIVFFILGFGQRLVSDFPGAANSFFYFTGTLITQLAIMQIFGGSAV